MKALADATDIQFLVKAFYEKVKADATIGYLFTEVAKLDFDAHLPVINSFWESVLFGIGGYKGNPMLKHIDLHRKEPLKVAHFDHWLALWNETVDEYFVGDMAEKAKQYAQTIKALMIFKIGVGE